MKIAVVTEVSTKEKNASVLSALENRGHEVFNLGMKCVAGEPELTYIHTGFLGAVLLGGGCVDLVVGGCGTGQGFLNSVLQYPGVCCGLIESPLDAWLFAQINGGNCVSLALNKGFGWAGDINLKLIFDQLYSVEWGLGYPAPRKESQQRSRAALQGLSRVTHMPLPGSWSAPRTPWCGLPCPSPESWTSSPRVRAPRCGPPARRGMPRHEKQRRCHQQAQRNCHAGYRSGRAAAGLGADCSQSHWHLRIRHQLFQGERADEDPLPSHHGP